MTNLPIGPSDMSVANMDEVPETKIEDSRQERTFGPGVDVLESLLSSEDFNQPVLGTWLWKRKGIEIPIRSLAPEEKKGLDQRHTKRFKIGDNNQLIHTELDSAEYNASIISLCVVDPDFQNPEVRNRIGRKMGRSGITALEAARAIFNLPGELDNLALAVIRLSGYGEEESEVDVLKG